MPKTTAQHNPWRELWVSLLDDVGILADDKPDTLSIVGLTGDQCDEYTSAVLELLHKESTQVITETAPGPDPWHRLCQFWKTTLDKMISQEVNNDTQYTRRNQECL